MWNIFGNGIIEPTQDELQDIFFETFSWQNFALCSQTDPEAFFPEKGGSSKQAKQICSKCQVRSQCLEYALKNDERFGIWGGLSVQERKQLRKKIVNSHY